jgi:hypothetical protein
MPLLPRSRRGTWLLAGAVWSVGPELLSKIDSGHSAFGVT